MSEEVPGQDENLSRNTEECVTQGSNVQGRSLFSLTSHTSNGTQNIELLLAETLERTLLEHRTEIQQNNTTQPIRPPENPPVPSVVTGENTSKEISLSEPVNENVITSQPSRGRIEPPENGNDEERTGVRFQTDLISRHDLPPTYSSVIHPEEELFLRVGQLPEDAHLNLMVTRFGEARPSPQFIYRLPPPSYAESELGTFYFDMTIPPVPETPGFWGPRPMATVCPICGSFNITRTRSKIDRSTHLLACFLCVCLCWPCCLLPYCTTSCQNTEHYCRTCSSLLGIYRPW